MSGWRWTITGVASLSTPGAMRRPCEETGELEAEGAGEVFDHLVQRGPWDVFDQDEGVSITVEPAEVAA